ncbi:MAG TPA: hypothetical protein VJM11_12050 [Nevskiaceae bacterium]|nr:hypothetical protein [Nevskiaceae bacterium]
MKRSRAARRACLALIAGFAWASGATAAEAIKLTSGVYQEQETVDASGVRKLRQVPATVIQPGSELVYVVNYANVSSKPANIVITNPMPSELDYRSASGAVDGTQSDVSVDGGVSFGALSTLRVKGTDGRVRPATAADITHVRWTVPRAVRPGEQGRVSLRAVVK